MVSWTRVVAVKIISPGMLFWKENLWYCLFHWNIGLSKSATMQLAVQAPLSSHILGCSDSCLFRCGVSQSSHPCIPLLLPSVFYGSFSNESTHTSSIKVWASQQSLADIRVVCLRLMIFSQNWVRVFAQKMVKIGAQNVSQNFIEWELKEKKYCLQSSWENNDDDDLRRKLKCSSQVN